MRSFLAFFGRLPGRLALLHIEDPLDRAGKRQEPLLWRSGESGLVVETVEHAAHDLVLLQHHGNGFSLVNAGVLLIVARILTEGRFQVLGNANIVHDQPGLLVSKHPVHSRDRLHEPVPPHGLVDVHCVHVRRVEAGEPHIPDEHQLERVVGVLRSLGEVLPARLAADVLLPFLRVRGRACHDDLDFAALVVVAVQLRAQL